MVVRDVRLIHPEDPQHISAYPLVLRKVRLRRRQDFRLFQPCRGTCLHILRAQTLHFLVLHQLTGTPYT